VEDVVTGLVEDVEEVAGLEEDDDEEEAGFELELELVEEFGLGVVDGPFVGVAPPVQVVLGLGTVG